MKADRTASIRQSIAALAMAATTTFALLAALGQIADGYHADERMAQDATLANRAVVAASAQPRS